MSREFVTAAFRKEQERLEAAATPPKKGSRKAKDEEQVEFEITLNEETIKYRKPSPAAFAIYLARTGHTATQAERVEHSIKFFLSLFNHDRAMLRKIEDQMYSGYLGEEDIPDVLEAMSEAWTANPSVEPDDSQPDS